MMNAGLRELTGTVAGPLPVPFNRITKSQMLDRRQMTERQTDVRSCHKRDS